MLKKDYVYSKRSKFLIEYRTLRNKLIDFEKKISLKLSLKPFQTTKNILVLPRIKDEINLIEILNKLNYYLSKRVLEDVKVSILVSTELKQFLDNSKFKLKNQKNYIDINSGISLITKKKGKYDLFLLWKYNSFFFHFNLLRTYKTEIIDKNYFSTKESTFWYRFNYNLLDERKKNELEELSIRNYSIFLDKKEGKKDAYLFLTGPNFEQYKNFSFNENSLKIICNSIVKNKDFLAYIKGPDLITFADPVFHFSPSLYSSRFRENVVEVSKKYDSFIMIPYFTVPIFLNEYPEMSDKVIGIKVINNKGINFPTPDKFWVKNSGSIISYMMIPVASSIADRIYMIGADGRKKNEKYFWEHNNSVQFHDLMETVFETHPSFFRDRYYDKHYEAHTIYLEKIIKYGENLGKSYFSLTPSYVPALKERLLKK